MSDSQFGSQYGSSASMPEPPYRGSDGQTQQDPAVQATEQLKAELQPNIQVDQGPNVQDNPSDAVDTSGVDVMGEIPHTSLYEPIPSSERTESFSSAHMGDTETMPTAGSQAVNTAATSVQQGNPGQVSPQPSPVSMGYDNVQVPGYASATRLESGYASQSAPQPAQRVTYGQQPGYRASGAYTASQAAPAVAATAHTAKKSSGGAGKSFLFGFLGALLACALAFGGLGLAGGLSFNSGSTAGSSVTLGSSNHSVINAVDEGQTLAEAVAAKALPSVVAIYNYQKQSASYGYGFGYGYGVGNQTDDSLVATGMGSGVVISDDGYIITNYHVVEGAEKLTVSVNGTERDATYVGGDSSSDIAVVKVDDTDGLITADIGDSDSLRIGEWVMTIGAPLGLESSVATGVVSATNRSTIMDSSTNGSDMYSYFYGNTTPEYTYYPNMIQTDAVINPGNSGGALVDADGKLIGINAMISSYSGDYAGVGFAIPINYAISLATDIIAGKQPTPAMMGVSLSQVNSAIAEQYNLSASTGAYISAITEGTGAADSDLAVGDIITKIDGVKVASPTDVTLEIRAHKVGDTVAVTVNRDGEEKVIDVVLSSDENMVSAPAEDSQDQEQEQGMPGPGRDNEGRGNGYNIEDLEELLEMLGR